MAQESKDPNVSVMLDAIRRRELLENNLSEDERWIEVDSAIAGTPLRIQILLPQEEWSTPRHVLAIPPVALRYESRMESWNLDYMVEAFDAIWGRHPTISGPWVTVTRTADRRAYSGRDAWDMNRIASMFRVQAGLKPPRGPDDTDDRATGVGEDVVSVEIHTERQLGYGNRVKETALEFHRGDDGYTEVVRFGTDALGPRGTTLLERVLENVLWGSPPESADVAELRAQIADLIELFSPDADGGDLDGTVDALSNRDEGPEG